MTEPDERVLRGLGAHLRALDAKLAAGASRVGWKVAFNGADVQQALGIPFSLVAALTNETREAAHSTHSLAQTERVALEAEVAVRVAADVTPQTPPGQVLELIEAVAPAIEIVAIDRPFTELETILTEGVFHRALRLGEFVPTSDATLSGIRARVTHAGSLVCDVDARDASGDPAAVLLHMSRLLAPFGERIAAGDIVILGAMNPLTFARAGASFSLELAGLGAVSVSVVS